MPRPPKRLPPELRKAAEKARADGWEVIAQRGHMVWTTPCGRRLQTSGTPSDHRTVKNELARLRRAGLEDR
ncbi:hypothetical protein DFP74_5772 [Nocardiopsis sp. Huas11]|uniref:type II toxin-antitoxin system HicA family toxin n=1 Tax=Nocardiopsis sp. Huas11 TaxID=2183912 RepID=UPI000EAD593B|nr:type II toxin-antitoxin system HicA family toxin [Nocardiopsis sp. Huas11]RKS10026.1 hypothetical protein DFP74_5772 [Nocardiopsis sp. Huas11]